MMSQLELANYVKRNAYDAMGQHKIIVLNAKIRIKEYIMVNV